MTIIHTSIQVLDAGEYFEIRKATSNVGFAVVELRSPDSGQPLAGFSFNQSDLIRGNTLSAAASWGHGQAGSLVALRGTLVTVAVAMTDSDLFSLWFGEIAAPASAIASLADSV